MNFISGILNKKDYKKKLNNFNSIRISVMAVRFVEIQILSVFSKLLHLQNTMIAKMIFVMERFAGYKKTPLLPKYFLCRLHF